MTQTEPTAPAVTGPLRTCIATGEEGTPERMIRFVVGPQGDVVPDLARRLPGRGMWVRAERAAVEHAVAKNLFAKSAKAAVRPAADLPERVERLLLERALADLGRARRAGRAVAGFVKVEQMIGQRRAGLVIVADEADGDGLGKLGRAACRSSAWAMRRRWAASSDASRRFMWRSRATMRAVSSFNELQVGAARWRGYRLNSAG